MSVVDFLHPKVKSVALILFPVTVYNVESQSDMLSVHCF